MARMRKTTATDPLKQAKDSEAKSLGRSVKKEETDNAKLKKKNGTSYFGKRAMSIFLSIGIILACFVMANVVLSKQNEMVNVIRIPTDLPIGTLITERNIESFGITREDYEKLGTVTYMKNGEKVTEQILIPYRDKTSVLNKYLDSYVKAGSLLTTRMYVDKLASRSAWIEKMKDYAKDYEIYTMRFSARDVYDPIFYPGCTLRVRMVYKVPLSQVTDVQTAIAQKEAAIKSGSWEMGKSGENSAILNAIKKQTTSSGSNGFSSEIKEEEDTIPMSEIVFNEITVVDMLNSAGESIFDLYYDLLSLPLQQRIEYVTTEISKSSTNEFKSRVTPASLVFSVSRDEATMLAEFENLGATLKYTILPSTEEDYNLMTQFSEISSQIGSYIDNAPVTSFD